MNKFHGLVMSPNPHITKPRNTTRLTMMHVLIALAPCLAAATVFFGHLVLINTLFCVVFCTALEYVFNVLFVKYKYNKANSAWDCSPAVTGVILALNMPTSLNIWGMNIVKNGVVIISFDTIIACLIGSIIAIVMVKKLFGGIGRNFANPAAVARIFLFVSFAAAFSNIYQPNGGINAVSSATWLSNQALEIPLLDMFFGTTGSAAVGETSAISILIGFVYLSIVRVIDFRIPLIVICATVVFVVLFDGFLKYAVHNSLMRSDGTLERVLTNPNDSFRKVLKLAANHLLSGGLLFGAVFMCTDYSSTPNTFWGRVVFAIGVALFTAILRTWAMPEGISFAIVIMNVATPLINRWIRPRFFGVEKRRLKKGGVA